MVRDFVIDGFLLLASLVACRVSPSLSSPNKAAPSCKQGQTQQSIEIKPESLRNARFREQLKQCYKVYNNNFTHPQDNEYLEDSRHRYTAEKGLYKQSQIHQDRWHEYKNENDEQN